MPSPRHSATSPPPPAATRLRRAVPEDAESITEVFLASRATAMPYLPRLHSDEQTLHWIKAFVLPHCDTWVAERGEPDEIVGFAALDEVVLDHLYVRPDVRGQGVGTALLGAVRAACPGRLTLHVFPRNTAARAFYERHGFQPGERNDGSRDEEQEPDIAYHWTAG